MGHLRSSWAILVASGGIVAVTPGPFSYAGSKSSASSTPSVGAFCEMLSSALNALWRLRDVFCPSLLPCKRLSKISGAGCRRASLRTCSSREFSRSLRRNDSFFRTFTQEYPAKFRMAERKIESDISSAFTHLASWISGVSRVPSAAGRKFFSPVSYKLPVPGCFHLRENIFDRFHRASLSAD